MTNEKTKRVATQISMRGTTYDKIREYCIAHKISIAKFVDELCSKYLDRIAAKAEAKPKSKPKQKADNGAKQTALDHRKVRW